MPAMVDVPVEAPAAQCAQAAAMTQQEADAALRALQASLKGTRFVKAWPAQMPGFVAVQTESGQVGYTDKAGRYFVVGIVFDTTSGRALDRQMDGHQ